MPENHSSIHGADLAEQCAEILGSDKWEIDIGGPEIFAYREITALAFKTIGKPEKGSCFSHWLCKATVNVTKPFTTPANLSAPLGGKQTLEKDFLRLEMNHALRGG